jgi:hypothetical protein
MVFISDSFRAMFSRMGFVADSIFTNPDIKAWRILPDRENCTWDFSDGGRATRLHVKRFPATRGPAPAKLEADGYHMLAERGIPTATVAAWGILDGGRSFIAVEDLAGFTPADKLVESGVPFDRLLPATADLAAALHKSGLHHRDLYLCHFMARVEENKPVELRLIDAARVQTLPTLLTRRRWIVKDLAQFRYSTTQLPISNLQWEAWLKRYGQQTGNESVEGLNRATAGKSAAIAAHDVRLRRRHPGRNISIPK